MSSSVRRDASPATALVRHGQRPASGPAKAILRFLGIAVAVAAASALMITAVGVFTVTSSVKAGVALVGEGDDPPSIGAIEGGVNLLLVGSDSGGGNAAYGERGEVLNDVTMLMHISEDHERATVVSFPRDLFVNMPACPNPDGAAYRAASSVKLNTALSRGGLACPVLAIEKLTGLDIPYAAVIEFDGVVAMSNAVGGVPVCVATAINDRQIGFKLAAGEHVIQGAEALMFLRSRYGVGDGSDLTRISNQQQFLSSLVRTLKSSETLSNPVKLYGIATAATRNLEFSNSLRNVNTMVSIAAALRDIPLDEVVFVKYPSAAGSVGGQSGVLQIASAAEALFDAIAADLPLELTGSTGRGTVAEPQAPSASPSVPASPSGSGSPAPTASGGAVPGPVVPSAVALPSTVEGQTASQKTCTAGQTAGG